MVEFNIVDIFEEEDCIVVKYATVADDGKPEVAEEKLDKSCTPKDIEAWAVATQARREELNTKRQSHVAKEAQRKTTRVRSSLYNKVQTDYT